jgi:hypothetical protein
MCCDRNVFVLCGLCLRRHQGEVCNAYVGHIRCSHDEQRVPHCKRITSNNMYRAHEYPAVFLSELAHSLGMGIREDLVLPHVSGPLQPSDMAARRLLHWIGRQLELLYCGHRRQYLLQRTRPGTNVAGRVSECALRGVLQHDHAHRFGKSDTGRLYSSSARLGRLAPPSRCEKTSRRDRNLCDWSLVSVLAITPFPLLTIV